MDFKQIYTKHYRELYGFALLMKRNKAEADDLVQEVFSKYFTEIQKGNAFENSRAWLYKVLLNLSNSQNKTKSLHQKYISNQSPEMIHEWEPDFFQTEKQQIVFSVLENMEDKDRELLLLYHNGLSYKEIADVLKMNPTSVGTTLVRAIEKLKNRLKSDYYEMFE